MERTKDQNNAIWGYASNLGLSKEEIGAMVHDITNGRTESTAQLTVKEANVLIDMLKGKVVDLEPSKRKMRSKILHICTDVFGWQFHDGSDDWPRFNGWMQHKSKHKKLLLQLTYKELTETLDQLEAIKQSRK